MKTQNLGVSYAYPFVMVFLFTKKGTEVYTGSLDRIKTKLEFEPPAHGIIHIYRRGCLDKMWGLFGNHNLRLEKLSNKNRSPWHPIGISKFRRPTWVLYDYDSNEILGSWRYLPSRFLRQLDKYDGPKRDKRRGGLNAS